MNGTPVTIENPEDIEEDFKNALSSFERTIEKVRPLFEHLATELDKPGVVVKLHDSRLEISIQCFHRDYCLSYEVEGQSSAPTGTLYLNEQRNGEVTQRAIARIDDNQFIGYSGKLNQPIHFNNTGLLAVVRYWLSQPLPNLKAPIDISYATIVN